MTVPAMHLAELNVGRLRAPTADPDPQYDAQLWKTYCCTRAAAE